MYIIKHNEYTYIEIFIKNKFKRTRKYQNFKSELFLCEFFCTQLGTLGAGNHYAEIQVVDEIFDDYAAKKMGIERTGQVCVMIHSGSRGMGHQVATGQWML